MADATPNHQYVCGRALPHYQASVKPLDRCQAYIHGKPCGQPLKAIGKGSRTKVATR